MPIQEINYECGSDYALVKVGLSKLPPIRPQQLRVMGDTDISEDVRDQELSNHIAKVLARKLPDKDQYTREGKNLGLLTGTVAGGGLGAALGSLIKSPGLGAMGGAALGGYLGHGLGKEHGKKIYDKDSMEQERLNILQYNDLARKLELAHQVSALKQFNTRQDQNFQRELKHTPEVQYRYNRNYEM